MEDMSVSKYKVLLEMRYGDYGDNGGYKISGTFGKAS